MQGGCRQLFSERQQALLDAAGFDYDTGKSKRYDFPVSGNLPGGFRLGSNGDSVTRRGTIFRKHLIIRSYYQNGVERVDHPIHGHHYEKGGELFTGGRGGGRKIAIRLEGVVHDLHGWGTKAAVPAGMRRKMIEAGIPERCAWLGSSTSLQVDHKIGRPNANGFGDINNPENYQFLTEHANQIKRSACAACERTGKRFDATEMAYSRAFLVGGEDFEIDGPGCEGCYLHDILRFRRETSNPQEPVERA